jgi:hypothetical protein
MTSRPATSWSRWARRTAWFLVILCVPLALLDGPMHRRPDFHPHFPFERWFGFYAGLSLLACLVLAAAAKIWQIVVRRPEDYYDV